MLIGLCGMPLSGKSEVRKILTNEYGFECLDTKEILRVMAAQLTGLRDWEFVTQEDKAELVNGVPKRTIMGELGNVAEKLWGDSYLLNRTLAQVDRWHYPNKRIVVDALRKGQTKDFPGLVYEVISDRAIDTGADFDLYDKSRINGIITNMGTLQELSNSVQNAFGL